MKIKTNKINSRNAIAYAIEHAIAYAFGYANGYAKHINNKQLNIKHKNKNFKHIYFLTFNFFGF